MAYHIEAFARQKRLKPLDAYLKNATPVSSRADAVLLASLRKLQARGVPMKIERIDWAA